MSSDLATALRRRLPEDVVRASALERVACSVDASLYRLLPQAVVRPRHVEDIRTLLAYATEHGRHITFRGAGTSLSGQAVGDDIVAETGPRWRDVRVMDEGQSVWALPGAVGGQINRLLAPFARRIGPDPASIDTATIGGILANNASGMCCGTTDNSYRTLAALTFVLADGTLVDTSRPDADERLRRERPDLHAGLLALRDRVRGDAELRARIRRTFSLKNTTGYRLDALLDYDTPAEILAHLMVGSQGTLAFVSAVRLRTVPEPPARATGLLLFDDLVEAGQAVPVLRDLGAAALEIMDVAALRAQEHDEIQRPLTDNSAALLVEVAADAAQSVAETVQRMKKALASATLCQPPTFTSEPDARQRLWRLRKGLFPAIGAGRPAGTATLIEDVAVPVESLASAIRDLQRLLVRHTLVGTAIFGHAKDGNLHFVLAEDFARPGAVGRYAAFMEDLVELVLSRYGGALKAEHGSGRNMAPFVRAQWGDTAYDTMRDVKRLLDPRGVMNPGVLLSDDPQAHLRHLKTVPPVSPAVDRCTECGFCEPRCPSRDVTLTPRQRIVVLRELARTAGQHEGSAWHEALAREFGYAGVETCVGDSSCQLSCPVGIDTGAAMKELRIQAAPPWRGQAGEMLSNHIAFTLGLGRAALRAHTFLCALPRGSWLASWASGLGHGMAPQLIPRLHPGLLIPSAAPPLPAPRPLPAHPEVVYFPSCLTRLLGRLPGEKASPLAATLVEVLTAAGFAVRIPGDVAQGCCGLAFASKGLAAGARNTSDHLIERLWRWSDGGRVSVVVDASPCALTAIEAVNASPRAGTLRVLGFPAFWMREVAPRGPDLKRRRARAVLHPPCSLRRQEGTADLLALAAACADEVRVPLSAECCGFAGDRGYFFPEVTEAALAQEAEEIRDLLTPGAALYSTSRTCEIGLSRAVGAPCSSVVHLVQEALLG